MVCCEHIIVTPEDRFQMTSTSKGNQDKWFLQNRYIKADLLGYESIAEALVSEFLSYCSGIHFVDYTLCTISEGNRHYEGCVSNNFLGDGESCISLYRVLQSIYNNRKLEVLLKKYVGLDKVKFVIDTVYRATNLNITSYLGNVLSIDAIILNEDRHLNNLAVIKDKYGRYKEAPIFDNGLSLLSDIAMYSRGLRDIRKVKSKPFSTSFNKQASYIGTKVMIDYNGFYEGLEHVIIPFKKGAFLQAKQVLLYKLRELEGKIWMRV